MFKLNFKIALRNLIKNKTSSLINIGGLSVGLAACLMLVLYIFYERGYDGYYKGEHTIYQVMVNIQDLNGHKTRTIGLSANTIAATLKQEYPQVKEAGRLSELSKRLLANGKESVKINTRYADPAMLQILKLELVSGNMESALNEPNSILLSENSAKRLFGTTDVVNRIVKFEDQQDLKVTAVIRDLPANLTYRFEALAPWKLFENLNGWPAKPNWGNHSFYTLLTLNKDTKPEDFNQEIANTVQRHFPAAKEDLFIYPLEKLHLYGDFVHGKVSGGKIEQVRILSGLAIGILLIACINFINLATSQAQKRTKEVGIKKTIGASRSALIFQFLLESMILTTVSILISITIAELFLPWFNNLLEIHVRIDYLNPLNWLVIFGLVLTTGCLGGFYPALFLSGFSPVQSLRKPVTVGKGYALSLRQVLVIVQFSFAVILITATITIYKQLLFIKNRPLGYNTNALIEIPHEGLLYLKYDLLKTQLLASGAVTAVTHSSSGVTNKDSSIRGIEWENMSESGKLIDFDQIYTSYDFAKTMGLKILSGRDFSKAFASDSAAVMLSNKAVETMELKNPVGATILHQGQKKHVIGVFDDFIWGNRAAFGAPMIISYADGISETITMRLNPEKINAEGLNEISGIVKKINPGFPVDIKFVDSLNEAKLKDQVTLSSLSNLFGCLSVFISCLGLFGLSAYSAQQRTKEIGVRKILGASKTELMQLLTLSFLKLVCISIVISLPAAYLIMRQWIQKFDVQTPLSGWIYILTALFTLTIALFTVSWQTYRAAGTNPVNALKYE